MNSTNASVAASKLKGNSGLNAKNADMWADNIHLTQDHMDPEDALTLAKHQKMLGDHDKFIEYIRHVENAKHQMFHNNLEEMKQLAAAG